MNRTARAAIGILAIATVAFAIGYGVALAMDDDQPSNARLMAGNGMYFGMMGAMGRGDWQSMQGYMRQVLGDEGYQRMFEHMSADGCQWTTSNGDPESFMHDMSYGMMYQAFNNGGNPPARTACWLTP